MCIRDRYVMTADIEKLYRQIKVHHTDINFQRIFWRNATDEPIRTYCLTTVTYGTSAAPFLATRCLKQLAIQEQQDFPLASATTLSDFYVDDLLTGSDSVAEA